VLSGVAPWKRATLLISNESALPFTVRLAEHMPDPHQFWTRETELVNASVAAEPTVSLPLFSVQPRQYVRQLVLFVGAH
jgi:hypothetical protein